jgi:hypothetical protein
MLEVFVQRRVDSELLEQFDDSPSLTRDHHHGFTSLGPRRDVRYRLVDTTAI